MFYAVSGEYTSLRKISIEAKSEHSLSLSKQGLDDRFSGSSIDFSKKLLEEAIHNQFIDPLIHDYSQLFNRVLIKDSTRFDIAESLKDKFPGFGGDGSKAGVSIQFEFDLKNGSITDMDLQSELDKDSIDAIKKKDKIQTGDLVIRDLGYYCYESMMSIHTKGAYFISRLFPSSNVFKSETGNEKIDFQYIYNHMKATKMEYQELNVFVGKERTLMRLVVCLLPENVYEKRIRIRNKKNKGINCKTTDEFKARAHFNLFITNVENGKISTESICKFYRIRWQIELVFKVWKSLMKINCLQKMKYERFATTLYMNMLWVLVHWRLIIPFRGYLYTTKARLISLFKCAGTLVEKSRKLRRILWLTKSKLSKEVQHIHQVFFRKSLVGKAKKR